MAEREAALYYVDLSDRILANNAIQELLVKNVNASSSSAIYADQTKVGDQLYDPTDTIFAIIVQKNGILYQPASGRYVSVTYDRVMKSEAYRKSLESDGRNLWISSGVNLISGNSEPCLYECRTLKSLEVRSRPLGQLIIQIPMSVLADTFKKINLNDGEYYSIFDPEGYCIYSTGDMSLIGKKADAAFLAVLSKQSDGYDIRRIGGKECLLSYSVRRDDGWNILHVLPMKAITARAERVRDDILIVMLASLLVLLPLSVLMSRSVSRPIRKLKSVVEEFGAGNLAVRDIEVRADEIGRLQASFNKMADDINSLLIRITDEHKQRRMLELSMLEYQINPHFLYNSLDSIGWLAKAAGSRETEELVYALSGFLRIGLSKGRDSYKVRDELEHVRLYMLINKIRYKNCFQFEIQADESVLDCQTIRIILQPVVENAVKYGVDKGGTNGLIRVAASKAEDTVLFEVSDNGRGIPPERVRAIRSILADHTLLDAESESGFGLFNVNQRIWLHYGEGYGITIDSAEGEGTTVRVTIPTIR